MNKKADLHLLEVLRDLIYAALILFIILVPTVYLIRIYFGADECPNQDSFKSFVDKLNDIENQKKQGAEAFFFNENCYITTFTQNPDYNEIKPPENKFTSPFICLCSIKNDKCILDSPGLCTDLTTFDKVGDNQFKTKGLDQYLFLTLKREDKNLLINTESSQSTAPEQKESSTEEQTKPLIPSSIDAQNLANLMEYAKANSMEGRTCRCDDNCQEYANWIIKYSNEYGIPDPLLIVSLMMQESGCKPRSCNTAGYGGLLQISCKISNWQNPEINIREGIKHLKGKYGGENKCKKFTGACTSEYRQKTYCGWDYAIRGYNGWGCNPNYPSQDRFVDEVIKRYEELKKIPQPQMVAQK